jgi:hypothetical protein
MLITILYSIFAYDSRGFQLRRAVAKILDAREKGFFRVLHGAAAKGRLTSKLAKDLETSHRVEEGDRVFLEVTSLPLTPVVWQLVLVIGLQVCKQLPVTAHPLL